MSKKMKMVALDSSIHEDAKTRFKHQTLMQDYQDLVKETEGMRNKLESTKQRKSTLLAEVRFLRRRYKYLLNAKSTKSPQEQLVKPKSYGTLPKNNMERLDRKKEARLRKLPQIFEVKPNERNFIGKEAVLGSSTPVSDLKQKEVTFSGKESLLHNPVPVFDAKQKETIYGRSGAALQHQTAIFDLSQNDLPPMGRVYGGKQAAFPSPPMVFSSNKKEKIHRGKEAAKRNAAGVIDLNQKERSYTEKEANMQTRPPIFDLNQISREEEEFQNSFQPSRNEEPKKFLIRGGSDEQLNDLKLSLCRNAGSGSNRVGKRKISWQDQVALRV